MATMDHPFLDFVDFAAIPLGVQWRGSQQGGAHVRDLVLPVQEYMETERVVASKAGLACVHWLDCKGLMRSMTG